MADSPQLIQIELSPPVRVPKPDWLRAKAPVGDTFHNLKKLARGLGLHTVCESAQCPNIGECWNHKTATFMLLGDICTRRCGFCAVPKGRPEPIDWDEPRRVAEAVATFTLVLTIMGGLRYAPSAIPWLVGLVITAAYWFTSSTSFANPAVTLARGFTTTFAGIAINHVPAFIISQLVGAAGAALLCTQLFPAEKASEASRRAR